MGSPNDKLLLKQLYRDLKDNGSTPLYICFAQSLREAINNGIIKSGEFLPSERIFTEALKISRITVRKALARLEQDNIIERGRGFGTQVKDPANSPLAYSLVNTKGFTTEVSEQGRIPGAIWLKQELVTPPNDIAKHLALNTQQKVYRFERIHTADGNPVSYGISYIVESAIGDINDIGLSLYEYLGKRNIRFSKLYSNISASLADNSLKKMLRIAKPTAILIIKQLVLDGNHQPLEYSISYCRSDMYEYSADQ